MKCVILLAIIGLCLLATANGQRRAFLGARRLIRRQPVRRVINRAVRNVVRGRLPGRFGVGGVVVGAGGFYPGIGGLGVGGLGVGGVGVVSSAVAHVSYFNIYQLCTYCIYCILIHVYK